MKFNTLVLFLFITLAVQSALSQNPIIKDQGVSDPHIRVFNDTVFLYSGHDSSATDRTWIMKDWRIFSTTDLLNWTPRGTISPVDNYMDDNSTDCWAGDAASRDGKYFFYFSDRKRGIGVMTSNTPVGPFKDALGKPLLAPMHDPTILIDDDAQNTPYIVYGDKEGGGFHIAKLNDDMISIAEKPKPIQINGQEWEDAPVWMDKNYIFKYGDTYYLSWGRDYAISKNIYGPYECVGAVGNGHNLNEFAHGSFFTWKGQFYHIWCYYLKQGFRYREPIITYCHMSDEGEIVTDTKFLDQHYSNGVGQYNASWDKIEAEWFYEINGEIQKKGNPDTGFVLENIKGKDWVRFANVTFDKKYQQLIANLTASGANGKIEIRTDSPNGRVIGRGKIFSNDQTYSLKEISFDLEEFTGKRDIYLIFSGPKKTTFTLDYIKFE